MGVVDLARMEAIYWNEADMGMSYTAKAIPDEMLVACQEWREHMVEAAAEADEALMDQYLESGELSLEDIHRGLRLRALAGEIVPVLCGSAFKNKGVQAVLDAVVRYLPAPVDVPAIKGITDDAKETPAERHASDTEPFAALAFKIATDPFVGSLTFFRVYSGVLKTGDVIFNPTKGKRERIGRIMQMHANSREEIKEVYAGDIAAAVGLKDVTTGETLSDLTHVITLEKMDFPEPVISVAVEPKSQADQGKNGFGFKSFGSRRPFIPGAHRSGFRANDYLRYGRIASRYYCRPHEA